MKKAFSVFADESGNITFDQLKLLLKDSLTQDDEVDDKALNKLMAQVDLDGDGKISYEEFVNMALGSPTGIASSSEHAEADQKEAKDGSRAATDHHLVNAIARASQQESKSRSNRDPPVHRPEQTDPPSQEQRLRALQQKKQSIFAEPEPSKTRKAMERGTRQEPVTSPKPPDELPKASPNYATKPNHAHSASSRRRRRVSPRDAKLEEACEGFDRVQEKIARLRMLLSAKDSDPKTPPRSYPRRSRGTPKRSPSIETLDSAFAKLGQIQGKMRALQALVKANKS